MATRKSSDLVRYQEAVTLWQARLGLDRWRIEIKVSEEPIDSFATVEPSAQYENATITFSPSVDDAILETVVVHELLHLFTRDIDALVDDAKAQLHPQASFQVEKRYEHVLESFVDRLSRSIVDLRNNNE